MSRVPSLQDLRDARAALAAGRGRLTAPAREKVLALARDRMYHGRRREAQSLLADYARLYPRDAESRFLLGLLRRFQGRHADSVAELRRAVALSPRAARPRLYLAEALLRAKKVDACLAVLRAGLRAAPSALPPDERGLLERHRLNLCALRFEEAGRLGDLLLARFPPAPGERPAVAWPIFHEDFELYRRPAAYLDRVQAALAKTPPSDWTSYFRLMLLGPWRAFRLERELRRDRSRLLSAGGPRAWMRAVASEFRLPG
ncbi:MAG: hypothetical protein SF051_02950 [Elusimicrobiota bacterium]|nr:hypothetical protein [Elusimicrobiota bacterium]